MAIRSNQTRTQYVSTGNPATVNDSSPYINAQPGHVLPASTGTYQYVQVDSGVTASTGPGVVAAQQLAFWKIGQKQNYIVTNDLAQSNRNEVAGVFKTAITSGYYGYVLQRAEAATVKGTSGAVGATLVANTGTAADTTSVAEGTAPTSLPVGIVTATTSGGNMTADLSIPSAP